jgi:GAF domain-containing protein
MAKVASEAGVAFDPRVVGILRQRYVEWEKLARLQPMQSPPKLSTDVKVERGLAPDAGFADSAEDTKTAFPTTGSLERVTVARQQSQSLIDLSHGIGSHTPLSLDDTLSLLSARLKRLVPQESMAVYLRKGDVLVPEFVSGENFRLFASLRIPLGKGLSGWVAQNHKPILNGNPLVEPGYLNAQGITLRSALAVPIEGSVGVVAVLALYRADHDAFSKEDLQVVETMVARLGASLEQSVAAKASVAHVGGD